MVKINKVITVAVLASVLSACASTKTQVVYGGQEYAMSRTVAERAVDFNLERDIIRYVGQINGIEDGNHRVAANAFRGDVLLTGEVPSQAIKDEIEQIVRSIRQVGSVYNYLAVGEAGGQSHTLHEQYLKSKIDARLLLKNQEISPSQYTVVVRDDIAYVLGVITAVQQQEMVSTIIAAGGMKQIALVNSLVAVDISGDTPRYGNMQGDFSKVNLNNRLIPIDPQVKTATQTIKTSQEQVSAQNVATQTATKASQTTNQTSAQTNAQTTSQNNTLSTNIAVFPNVKHGGDGKQNYTYQNVFNSVEPVIQAPQTQSTQPQTAQTQTATQSPAQTTAGQSHITTNSNPPPQWQENVPYIAPASQTAAQPVPTTPVYYPPQNNNEYVQLYGTIIHP